MIKEANRKKACKSSSGELPLGSTSCLPHVSYGLNSVKGTYIGDYIRGLLQGLLRGY